MFEISLLVCLIVIIFYLWGVIRELMELQKILIEIGTEINDIKRTVTDIDTYAKRTVTDIDTYAKYGSVKNISNYEDGFKKLLRIEKEIKKKNE